MYKDRLARTESKNGWFEYAKDATEALFEHIRRREFANRSISRLYCCYYVASLEEALRLGQDDWGNDSALKILEVEIDDRHVMRYDQAFYNQAYELFVHYRSEEDIRKASGLARRYFAGEMSAQPLPELLADGENRIRQGIQRRRIAADIIKAHPQGTFSADGLFCYWTGAPQEVFGPASSSSAALAA